MGRAHLIARKVPTDPAKPATAPPEEPTTVGVGAAINEPHAALRRTPSEPGPAPGSVAAPLEELRWQKREIGRVYGRCSGIPSGSASRLPSSEPAIPSGLSSRPPSSHRQPRRARYRREIEMNSGFTAGSRGSGEISIVCCPTGSSAGDVTENWSIDVPL